MRFSTLTLLLLLAAPLPAAGSSDESPSAPTFVATMEVKINDSHTVARIWARPGLLRLETQGGRVSSAMITRYREGKTWSLIPAAARYQEFPVSSLRDNVPHFFDPALQVREKKRVGCEEVDGRRTVKYEVVLDHPGRRSYYGTLWEAADLPGYPIQWLDSGRKVQALWKNARLSAMPDSLFALPPGYAEQKANAGFSLADRPQCERGAESPGQMNKIDRDERR